MAVTMKNAVFRHLTPCGSCKNRPCGRSVIIINGYGLDFSMLSPPSLLSNGYQGLSWKGEELVKVTTHLQLLPRSATLPLPVAFIKKCVHATRYRI
jgi:hypothetical protein